jgi:hypothetical protein
MPSAFVRLFEASMDPHPRRLAAAYDHVLRDLFQNPFWDSGAIDLRRVLWNQGRRARDEDRETFRSPGLYLWGVEERPLCIGITRGSFRQRFSRYIWQRQSQCNLAQEFGPTLRLKGIEGFPPEIRDWYAKSYRGSTVPGRSRPIRQSGNREYLVHAVPARQCD